MNIYIPPRLIPEAFALIKHFEGCFLEAYRDPVGVMTIGYGHTGHVKRGMSLKPREAEDLLMEDLEIAQSDVRHHVKVPLSDNEFGALVSLAFNIGGSALAHSTLIRKLNKGDRAGAAAEFDRFVHGHVGGRRVKLRGLVLRRQAEREMFEAPPGSLVRGGKMALAGRTIPVEYSAHDVAQASAPPQHFYYSPYPLHPPPGSEPSGAAAPVAATAEAARPTLARASLVTVAAGAAVGAVPATQTPATQGFIAIVDDLWQRLGGPDVLGSPMAWSRWHDAFTTGIAAIFNGEGLAPFLSYLSEFINSHEAVIALAISVALMLFRIGLRVMSSQPSRRA